MPVLITGGCGFLGTNLAHRLIAEGRAVHLYDSLACPGSERNLQWLRERHGEEANNPLLTIEIADIRDWRTLSRALNNASEVYHFAAQESFAPSQNHPLEDFEINARGTVHLLNAIRESGRPIPVVFTSSSKVYGPLCGIKLRDEGNRYSASDRKFRGVNEQFPLEPRGPYACSKAAADLYVLDFARSYAIPSVVLRIGSVYGPNQYGTEDQGWLAHLMLRILRGHPVTIFGDGKQVRDPLHIEDLINALVLAQAGMDRLEGEAYNLGGGRENALSLLQMVELAGRIGGRIPQVKFAPWRSWDQRFYVTDFSKFQAGTRWAPRIGIQEGLEQLYRWMVESRQAPGIRLAGLNKPLR